METLKLKTISTSRASDQFSVRFPAGMRDRIHEAAKASGRSMNSEIVHCLGKVYPAQVAFDHTRQQEAQTKRDEKMRADWVAQPTRTPISKPETAALSPPVTIKELAGRVKMDRSACRQYVLRMGYKPTKQRMADSGFQLALTVTANDARDIQAKRASEGYCEAP